jgi:hypothetical protein
MNVLVLKTTQDDKHERTISSFGTNDLALINLYGTMRACVGDSNIRLAVAEMIDDRGNAVKCERFERPAEVKTPESEASE